MTDSDRESDSRLEPRFDNEEFPFDDLLDYSPGRLIPIETNLSELQKKNPTLERVLGAKPNLEGAKPNLEGVKPNLEEASSSQVYNVG